jgi:hypothetical protein
MFEKLCKRQRRGKDKENDLDDAFRFSRPPTTHCADMADYEACYQA